MSEQKEREEKSWFLLCPVDWICPSCHSVTCRACAHRHMQHLSDGSIVMECPQCANKHAWHKGTKVTFQKLSKKERGYIFKGTATCAFCNSVFRTAIHQIPIEFKSLKCPKCGKTQFEITPELIRKLKNGEFTFKINVICKNRACRLSSLVTRSFKGFFANIKKIVISLKEGKMEIEKYRNEET